MTPPAATAAGRVLPRTVAPRTPRRVSGPAARPRRGEDARRRAPARSRAAATDPFIFRVLRGTQQLADSRLLDRLIRGRLWIPLVAAALMGIVFMQVSMLKLNAGIGRAVQSEATLERQNQNLRADVSRLEAGSRIDGAARQLGMVVPADGSTSYVRADGDGQAQAAARRMVAADPQAIARAQAGAATTPSATTGTATTAAATATATTTTTAATTQSTAPTGTTATAPQTAATTPTTTTSPTGTGTTQAAAGAGATGTTGAAGAPSAVAQAPSGAAASPTQQQQASTSAGGTAAPGQG